MKKRILSIAVIISIMFSMFVPIQTFAASNADDVILSRIETLAGLLEGKYFNQNRDTACGAKCNGHGCEFCDTAYIVSCGWFTDLFGTPSTSQFPATYVGNEQWGRSGRSCFGFAAFAEWYIFKNSASDVVDTYNAGTYSFDYANVSANAKVGDILRFNGHSAIYISADETGVYVLDCNWMGSYNCMVARHVAPYSYSNDFTISRANNRDSIAPQPTQEPEPQPTDITTPTPETTEIPTENLKYGDYLYYDINSDNTVTITKCDKSAEKIAIPYRINGMDVSVIGDSAFAECNNLTSVTIPISVTSIMQDAFYHCNNLTSVTIPDSVVTIGDEAFCLCGRLNSITLSNNLTSIGWEAFSGTPYFQDESNWENGVLYMNKYLIHARSGEISSDYKIKGGTKVIGNYAFLACSSLTSITIPESVTNIGEFAFEDCTGLTDVHYSGTKAQWDAISIELNNSELIYANIHCSDTDPTPTPKPTKPPVEIKYGDYLYYAVTGSDSVTITKCDKAAEKIAIPNRINGMYVSAIGESAFANCDNLTSVTIPISVTSIMQDAFYHCDNLTSVTMPDSVYTIGDRAFSLCGKLNNIIMPKTVTSIGQDAFQGTPNFQWENDVLYMNQYLIHANSDEIGSTYTIKDGTQVINNYAFSGCDSLKSVTIPDSVTSIGNYVFEDCDKLTDVYYLGTKEQWEAINNNEDVYVTVHYAYIDDSDIPIENLQYNDYLYYMINRDNTITITHCDNSASKIEIPDRIKGIEVTSIETYAFSGCLNLTSVKIPNSVVNIGQGAFYNCYSLAKVIMSNSVTSIDRDAFKDCSDLTDVFYLGTKAQWAGIYIGSDNDELINANIHPMSDEAYETPQECLFYEHGIYNMGYYIKGCDEEITHLVIPSKIEDYSVYYSVVGLDSFGGNENLKSVTIPNNITEIKGVAFSQCSNLEEIIVDENNQACCTIDGNLFSKDKTTLLRYIPTKTETSYTIPDTVKYIGSGAFADCVNLKNITVPDSVTGIGATAFRGCSSLTSITMPEGVTYLGRNAFLDCSNLKTVYYNALDCNMPSQSGTIRKTAFDNCTSLEEIRIGNNVNRIPSYAFDGCISLKSITIPSSVESMGSCAFRECENVDSIYISDLTAYLNIDGYVPKYANYDLYLNNKPIVDLVIPDGVTTIKDEQFKNCASLKSVTIPDSVTSIGKSAFEGCIGLTSIEIPDSVTSIGYSAFKGCTDLTDITILNGITSIDSSAFEGCTSLTSVTVPDSVTSIGYSAFEGCTSLTSVTIPDSVTYISGDVFVDCSSLKSINVDENNQNYCSIDGNLFSKDKKRLIQYAVGKTDASYEIPKGVNQLESYAFKGCTSLKSVEIPDSVTTIFFAFYGCTGLTSVTIPDSVTTISGAFKGCTGLTSVTISDSVTTISGAFEGCTGLTSVTIPDSVTDIGAAFKNCTGLTSIEIPDSVTSIGSAFYGCTGLTSVEIPDSIKILDETFYGCTNLKNVAIPDSVTNIRYDTFYGCIRLESVEIPDSVTNSMYYTFYGCTGLKSVKLSQNTQYISTGAFYGCTGLESIKFSKEIKEIHTGAFDNCNNLKDVYYTGTEAEWSEIVIGKNNGNVNNASIHYNVTLPTPSPKPTPTPSPTPTPTQKPSNLYGEYLTYKTNSDNTITITRCDSSAVEVAIPDKINGLPVTSVDYNAFANCADLTSVTIPDSVTGIEGRAFDGCTNLKNIVIPNSVESIGYSAFSGCTSLEKIAIPDSVKYLEEGVFNGCTYLTSVTLPNGIEEITYGMFEGCSRLKDIEIPPSVTTICADAFSGCANLREITIPDGVTQIYNRAFEGCNMLMSIEIPNSVTYIGSLVFRDCEHLSDITIPDSVTYIGYGMLYNTAYANDSSNWQDGALYIGNYLIEANPDEINSEFTIKNSTKVISNNAFSGCANLTKVTIPDNVISIGDSAFSACENLTDITIQNGVKEIGEYAFDGCVSLTSISIPDSVTDIDWGAFANCEGLKNVTIGSGTTYLGSDVFENCVSLESIEVDSRNKNYCSIDGDLLSKDKTEFIMYAPGKKDTSYSIPEGVTTIVSGAFEYCDTLESITIPEGVTYIGYDAFNGCTGLSDITVPDSLMGISSNIFADTAYYKNENNWENGVLYIGNHLVDVNVDELSSTYNIKPGTKTISNFAFEGCTGLESITIPDSMVSIGENAFSGCRGLSKVIIPDGVKNIGANAFYDCINLDNITVPDSVTSIGYGAFNDTAYFNGEANWKDGVLCIGNHLIAVDANEVVSEITIGDNIINIANGVFDECDTLTNINVNAENPYYTSVDGNLFSKDKTVIVKYASGKSDSHYIVPDGVTSIDDAFYGSKNLKVITIPTSVKLDSYYTFANCDSLTDIYYLGTEEEWYSMEVTNDLTGATIHFGTEAPNPDIVETSPDTYTISNIQPTDSGVTLTVHTNKNVSGKQTVIAAYYDENNVFIGLQQKQITASEEEQTISFDIENENVVSVKAFIWNALDNMMPASNPVTLEI